MFTGIIEGIGIVRQLSRTSAFSRIGVEAGSLARGVKLGDSISVDGVCLTVSNSASRKGTLGFDVVRETLNRTTLSHLRVGDRLNLERSMRLADRIGGHLVSGHIDGIGFVREVRVTRTDVSLTIRTPSSLSYGLVHKGSIAVRGVSLTIASVAGRDFAIALVPHTLRATNLGACKRGDAVNLEIDLVAKWIANLMRSTGCRLSNSVRKSQKAQQ